MKADQTQVLRLLKTARGQIDGVIRMVEEDRYCIDISNQIQASAAILNKVNQEILSAHIRCCVSEALHSGEQEADAKIEEILAVLQKAL